MSVNRQDVMTRLPELSDIEDSTYVDTVIEAAKRQVSQKRWGKFARDGIILLSGHLLELGKRSGHAGAVKMTKVDELQRSYAVSDTSGSLNSTSYGLESQRLLKLLPTRPLVC